VTVRRLGLACLLAAAAASSACSSADVLGNLGGGAVGAAGGDRRLGDLARVAAGSPTQTAQQISVQFTPEQEYELGRAVAASAAAQFGLDPDERLQEYVRSVGHSIVALSARLPGTYGGWHFGVLNTDEVNGVAGPGGFVLVTRGAVKACRNEEELAAVLAHEMAHVSLRHGESALRTRNSNFRSALGRLAALAAAASNANDQGFTGGLANFFEQAVQEATKTAVEHSYGRDAEFKADLEGVYLLYEVGYDGSAMKALLTTLGHRHAYGGDTHGSPAARAAQIDAASARYGGFHDPAGRAARDARFRQVVGGGASARATPPPSQKSTT
jgi:predicted Zn-dependent protease